MVNPVEIYLFLDVMWIYCNQLPNTSNMALINRKRLPRMPKHSGIEQGGPGPARRGPPAGPQLGAAGGLHPSLAPAVQLGYRAAALQTGRAPGPVWGQAAGEGGTGAAGGLVLCWTVILIYNIKWGIKKIRYFCFILLIYLLSTMRQNIMFYEIKTKEFSGDANQIFEEEKRFYKSTEAGWRFYPRFLENCIKAAVRALRSLLVGEDLKTPRWCSQRPVCEPADRRAAAATCRTLPGAILKRAGTTLAAESRASNVITQAATTINPGKQINKRN